MRIDEISDAGVTAKIRGGALLPTGKGLELLKPGAVLRPIVRHFDAHGETIKTGVFPVAWTWLNVESVDGAIARCTVQTGVQDPLALQYDGRTEYLGLAVATRSASQTELIVRARAQAISRWRISKCSPARARTSNRGSSGIPIGAAL